VPTDVEFGPKSAAQVAHSGKEVHGLATSLFQKSLHFTDPGGDSRWRVTTTRPDRPPPGRVVSPITVGLARRPRPPYARLVSVDEGTTDRVCQRRGHAD
jgi:hypothetical protein